MTQEQLSAIEALYAQIGPQVNSFVAQYGFETLREGIETINSKRSQQTSLEAISGIVTCTITDASALAAMTVPISALPSLMDSFNAAMAAGSPSVGAISLAIAMALSQQTR